MSHRETSMALMSWAAWFLLRIALSLSVLSSGCGAGPGVRPPSPPLPPTITSISPTSGGVEGQLTVTITGTGFQSPATVFFGDTAAPNVTVTSPTQVQSVTPAHSAGTVDVIVTNPDGRSAILSSAFTYTTPPQPGVWYISPSGSDRNNGRTAAAPFKTFAKAFSAMAAGNTLILLDGTYSDATTGLINSNLDVPSGIPPNGTSVSATTLVTAQNPGNVKITGQDPVTGSNLWLGTRTAKVRFVMIKGVTFEGGGNVLYNTDHVYLKECGFHSQTEGGGAVLAVGTNDGDWGNTFDLLEDIWAWGKERIVLIVFRSNHIVVRRAVIRQDGCSVAFGSGCSTSGNAVLGTTIYNSSFVSFQNVIGLDAIYGPTGVPSIVGDNGCDFCTAYHTSADGTFAASQFGANEWLGDISLNSAMDGFNMDPDNVTIGGSAVQPIFTFNNIVAWAGQGQKALNPLNGSIGGCAPGTCSAQNFTIRNATLQANSPTSGLNDIFRIGPEMNVSGGTYVIQNVIATGSARYMVNTPFSTTNYIEAFGRAAGGPCNAANPANCYGQPPTCLVGCFYIDPQSGSPAPLKYLPRIEGGSALKGAGFQGADIGANVTTGYGVDGTFWGDPQYNLLTLNALWPWPNEARIVKEMCTDSGVTRGFCSQGSITRYIWTYLGNPLPPTFSP